MTEFELRANIIVNELMEVLDSIRREAERENASRYAILGAAEFGMARCNRQREQNSDGYWVIKGGVR
jgi:hypothetical protein